MAKAESADDLRFRAELLIEAAKKKAAALITRAQTKESTLKDRTRKQEETRKKSLSRALTAAVRDNKVDLDELRAWADPRVIKPSDRRAIGLNPTFTAPKPRNRSMVWGGLVLQLLREKVLDVARVQGWVDTYLGEKARFTVEVPKEPQPVVAPPETEPTTEVIP